MDGAQQTFELLERCEAPFHAARGYANAEQEPSVNAEPSPVRSGVGGAFALLYSCPKCGEVTASPVEIIDVDRDDVETIMVCECGREVKPLMHEGKQCVRVVEDDL